MSDAPQFQINKYVAIPAIKRNAWVNSPKKAKCPWAHMQPGDSFFVPGAKAAPTDKREGCTLHFSAFNAKKKFPGTEWTVRAVTENGVNGARVWRVK